MFSGLHFLRCDARDHSAAPITTPAAMPALRRFPSARSHTEWRPSASNSFSTSASVSTIGSSAISPSIATSVALVYSGWRASSKASPWVFASGAGVRVATLQKGFDAACKRCGIDDFRIHDLRHTFASWLVMDGVSLYLVKDLLGHSSVAVTKRYAHLSPDQGRVAVQQLLAR